MSINDINTKYTRAQTQCPWCKSRESIIKDGEFICSRCSYRININAKFDIKVIGWTNSSDTEFLDFDCKLPEVYYAIVKEIKEKGYYFDWGAHQSNQIPCTPIINNGYKILCSPKTWGSIMAEAHSKNEFNEAIYAEVAFGIVPSAA